MSSAVRTMRGTSATKVLRGELLSLGMELQASPGKATLQLDRPRISPERLEGEWNAAMAVLRPDIAERISLQATYADGRRLTLGATHLADQSPAPPPRAPEGLVQLPRRDPGFAVEKILIWAWLTGRGPVTRTWLERTAGCSYPTVASVVRKLGSALVRHPDRRIELGYLPRAVWGSLAVSAAKARHTVRYADISGQPTSADALLSRFERIASLGVALGGVAGMRRHHDIDLVGLPRVDLSVHAPDEEADLGFLRRLDPGLRPVTDPTHPAVLAVHFVRHRESLFDPAADGPPAADVVECLLDLHEAGLDAQAADTLDALRPKPVLQPA